MPIKCSKISGLLIEPAIRNEEHCEHYCCGVQGFNEAITQQGSVKLQINRRELMALLISLGLPHSAGLRCKLADAIIARESELFEVSK